MNDTSPSQTNSSKNIIVILVCAVVILLLIVVGLVIYIKQTQKLAVTHDAQLLSPFSTQQPNTQTRPNQQQDPFAQAEALMQQMQQRSAARFHQLQQSMSNGFLSGASIGHLQLADKGNAYVVTMTLPNPNATHVNINVTGRTLTVSGKSDNRTTNQQHQQRSFQHVVSNFSQSITLAGPVDTGKMTSNTDKGVLTIVLPKVAH